MKLTWKIREDEPKHFEIESDSDVCVQSVAGQTEVVKEVNLLKEHVDFWKIRLSNLVIQK